MRRKSTCAKTTIKQRKNKGKQLGRKYKIFFFLRYKTNTKMAIVDSSLTVITLNVNGSNSSGSN